MSNKIPCILIVDDEVDICEMMSYAFQNHGFSTEIAHDPEQAIKLLNSKPIDVVLSDVRMPKGGGKKLLEDIKRDKLTPKVFLMSGYSDSPVGDALAKDVVAVFAKPMKIKEIVEQIRKVVL